MIRHEQLEAFELLDQLKALLDEKHNPGAYSIVLNCDEAAGQTIPHAHLHVIPRYTGDMENLHGRVRGVIP